MRACSNRQPYKRCLACDLGVPAVFCHAKWMTQRHAVYSVEEGRWMAIEKPAASSGSGSAAACVTEGMLPKKYPTLFEYLSADAYSDGSARQTSTLLVFVEGGTVKLCLNDRQEGRTMWAAGLSLEGGMDSLEKRLAKGDTDWRPSGQGGARKGKGR